MGQQTVDKTDQRERTDVEKRSYGTETISRTAGGALLGSAIGAWGGLPGMVVGALVGGVAGATLPHALSGRTAHKNGKHA